MRCYMLPGIGRSHHYKYCYVAFVLLSTTTKHRRRCMRPFIVGSSAAFVQNLPTTTTTRMQTFWYTGRKEYDASDALLSPGGGLEARKRNGQDTENNDKTSRKKQRRINRPGFNSYLKVLLEDEAMDILHQMSTEIQKRLNNESDDREETAGVEGNEHNNQQGGVDKPGVRNDRRAKKPLRFKPRSLQSLHMTLFFGGETICALPSDELIEWHRRLSIRLACSGFMLSDNRCSNETNPNDTSGKYSFHLKGLKVFPPHRNNLIVAVLEPSPLWHDLHNDIRQIAQDESCSKDLAAVSKFSKGKWVAHITLGNLYGGPKSKIKSLQPLLDDIFEAKTPRVTSNTDSSSHGAGGAGFQSNPIGISMGGPMPEQVDLDWDFRFRPLAVTREEKQTSSPKKGSSNAPANTIPKSGVASDRCVAALKPSSPYAEAFMQAMDYQYDAVSRPDGYVSLCVAENKLSIDILATKLTEMETTKAAFSDPAVFCYNSFQGLPFARQVAASFIEKKFLNRDASIGRELPPIDPSHIGIGSGAAGILHSLFFLLGNNGDCCLIPTPYYAAFENQMSLVAGISPFGFHVENPVLGPTESELDLAFTAAKSSGLNPKFLLITNPHNPLGIIYQPEVVAATVTWARKRNLHTIADEVYSLSIHRKVGHGFQSIIQILDNQLGDNVHWVWSVSKDFGASGLRVGYLYSQNEKLMKAFANLNGFSGVSQPMQMIVSKVLSDDVFIDSYLTKSRERLLRNYNACTDKLNELGLPYVCAEAGLFIYADFSSLLPEPTMEWESKLSRLIMERSRVLLTPGESQREQRPGMFRICYAWVTPEELRVGMERLGRLVKKARDSTWADLE